MRPLLPPLLACLLLELLLPAAAAAAPAGAAAAGAATTGAAPANPQREPELEQLLKRVATESACYSDRFESEVWHKAMEQRLQSFVPTHEERIDLLDEVYCESKRDPTLALPPDLVLALIEVESRFDRFAVSAAGAVGLMQVMPFWPRRLGLENQLVRVGPNIRMGCEILRYYLRTEHHDWPRALARYNGSVGRARYPELVMQRWRRVWRF
ncbi:MAG TPA: lytic transglycosylase domain-containing protein [Steroidobacteraceae bacterium]|nr:lytic transglycosylase domain-containing protein [Steroidobacteraceae bacterium]